MTNKQALREAAREEIMLRSVSDTSDAWQDLASPEVVLALLDELEAKDKRIAELEASHGNLREAMAGIHNTITGGGAYTPMAAILAQCAVDARPDDAAAVKNLALAEIALAALTAEPAYFINRVKHSDAYGDNVELRAYCYELDAMKSKEDFGGDIVAVFTAPPASVVPPAIEPDYDVIKGILPTSNPDEYACCIAADMWNACRAAMLQGAAGNSQVIPDGYALVPVEPTEDMVIHGFESVPHPLFQPADWDKYQTMSGCEQAAHRAKLCWAAMIAAAPQQEAEFKVRSDDRMMHPPTCCHKHPETVLQVNPFEQLMSYPPQSKMYCPECEPRVAERAERDRQLRKWKGV